MHLLLLLALIPWLRGVSRLLVLPFADVASVTSVTDLVGVSRYGAGLLLHVQILLLRVVVGSVGHAEWQWEQLLLLLHHIVVIWHGVRVHELLCLLHWKLLPPEVRYLPQHLLGLGPIRVTRIRPRHAAAIFLQLQGLFAIGEFYDEGSR